MNRISQNAENTEEVAIVKKKCAIPDITPKRSLIKPRISQRTVKGEEYDEQLRKEKIEKEEEERIIKKAKKPKVEVKEVYQGKLAEDVAALIDNYRSASEEKKPSIDGTLSELKKRLVKEGQDIVSQYQLPEILPSSNVRKKKDFFLMYYAKDRKNEERKASHGKYAISYGEGALLSMLNSQNGSVLPKVLSTSRLRGNREHQRNVQDKRGLISALGKVDVTNLSSNAKFSLHQTKDLRVSPRIDPNMLYNHGEIYRQIDLSTMSLRMKKSSEINNYEQADNSVLQQNLKTIKGFTSLPKVVHKK